MLSLERINKAREAGYSDDDIAESISKYDPEFGERISKARESGYDSTTIMQSIENRLKSKAESPKKLDNPQGITLAEEEDLKKTDNVKQLDNEKSWYDHFAKGMERSVSGGAQSDQITEDPGFWSGLVEFAGETIGDLPYMAAGGSLGSILGAEVGAVGGPWGAGVGGLLGGGAGALALPTFLKQAMKEYRDYAKDGHDITFGEFLERADRVGSETLKSGVMGAILGQVSKAAPLLAKAPGIGKLFTSKIGQKAAEVGLETAALGTIPKASHGEIPTSRDYAEALAMVLGFQVAKIPGKIREGIERLGQESGLSPEEFAKSISPEEQAQIKEKLDAEVKKDTTITKKPEKEIEVQDAKSEEKISQSKTNVKQLDIPEDSSSVPRESPLEKSEVKQPSKSKSISVKPAELSVSKPKEEKKPEPIIETTGEGAEQRLEYPKTNTQKFAEKASQIVQAARSPSEVRDRVITLTFDALEPLNKLESELPLSERVTTKIKQSQNAASTINTIIDTGIFDNITNRFEPNSSLDSVYSAEGELWKNLSKGLKPGEYSLREMDIYRASKENLKRQAKGLKSGMDTEISKKDVARLKQKYGPIDQRLLKFQTKCLDHYGKDLLSPKTREEWSQDSHASLYRVMDYGNDAMLPQGSLQPKKPWFKAKGSGRKVLPPSETDIKNLSMLVSNAKKNDSMLQYKKLVEQGKLPGKIKESKNKSMPEDMIDALELDPEGKALAEQLYNQSRKNAWTPKEGVIRGWENGKPFEIEVPGDVYETFSSLAPTDTGTFTNLFRATTRIFSKGITYEPVKHLSIFGRDAHASLIFSKTGSNPISIVEAMTDIYKDSHSWRQFKALGGEQYATRLLSRGEQMQTVEKLLKIESPNVTIVPFKKMASWLSKNSSNLAASVPFAEYQRALKKYGDTPDGRLAALIESKSVSYDPNRKGSSKLVRGFGNYFPFFNPMLQEPYLIAKNMKRPQFWAKGALGITLPALILKMFNDGNPDYDDLSPITKTMFFHIYTPAGHIACPAPWLLGALFKGVPEAFYDTVKGEGGEAWKGLYSYVASQMAGTWNPMFTAVVEQTTNRTLPSPGSTIFYPFIEADTRAPPVVPRRLENLPPEQQYTSKTSQLARWYGDLWKVSPVKVDRLIKTFGGGLAQDALALIDEMAYASGLAEDLRPEGENYLLMGKFLSSNTPTQTKYAKMFYERLETERMAKQRDEKNDYKKYDSYNNKIRKQFSKYRDIENQKINPSTKREMLEDTQKKINALYKEAIQRGNNA